MGQMDTRRWSVIPKMAAGFGVIGVVRLHRSTGWTLRALVACGLVELIWSLILEKLRTH
jgi:hypothetical protein